MTRGARLRAKPVGAGACLAVLAVLASPNGGGATSSVTHNKCLRALSREFAHRPKRLTTAPATALTSILGVLRQPTTPADRLPAEAHALTVVPAPAKEEGLIKKAHEEVKEEVKASPASVKIEKVKIARSGLVITLRASQEGTVTIAGPGLRKTVRTVPAGIERVVVAFTEAGRAERKQRKKIKLAVSLKTSSTTVSGSEKIKL